jgi:transcriptional regulator of acetoin/glycerol metabolism
MSDTSNIPVIPDARELRLRVRQVREAWERFITSPGEPLSAGDVRPFVVERWLHSLGRGVDPKLERAPSVLDRHEVEEFLRTDELGVAGRAVLDNFSRVVESSGCFAVLADERGRVLYQVGHLGYVRAIEAVNCMPGAWWAEDVVGPSGIGSALAVGAHVFMYGPEHLWESLHALACDGCPIVGPFSGRVTGSLTLAAPIERFNPAVRELTASLGRAVERTLAMMGVERRCMLLDEFLQAQRRWPGEGIAVVDQDGRVIELNARALEMLGGDQRLARNQPLDALLPDAGALLRRSCAAGTPAEILSEGLSKPSRVRLSPLASHGRVSGALIILSPVDATRSAAGTSSLTPKSAAHCENPDKLAEFADLRGQSPALLKAIRLGQLAARSDKAVLLTGETGTGKELLAQAIHAAGPRAAGPFVALNCAALPAELVESELFGYAPGAFTGARREGSPGKFELAHGGTIFLDEISAMALATQPKLLRVLETKTIQRINSGNSLRVDVKVIAATNDDLRALCDRGQFRADLFYRLNVLAIRLPALRERPEDIVALAQFFIAQECARAERPVLELCPETIDCLLRYDWPGNVRELKNLCARWVESVRGPTVTLEEMPEELLAATYRTRSSARAADSETERIRETLEKTNHNVSETARRLGISRTTVYAKAIWPYNRVLREAKPPSQGAAGSSNAISNPEGAKRVSPSAPTADDSKS